MPQVGAHLIIADRLNKKIQKPIAKQQLPAYYLGAVGPDLTFFLFDRAEQRQLINTAITILRTVQRVAQTMDEIGARAQGPAADFSDWITGGLSTSVGDLVREAYDATLLSAGLTLLPKESVVVANPFAGVPLPGVPQSPTLNLTASDLSRVLREFGHPYTEDQYHSKATPGSYDKWWWLDVLHYRRTGPFAKHLSATAKNSTTRAFARGYWTHVAGDVCGHPFVNSVVGGPYRNHVIRHMVLENIIDTWLWSKYQSADVVSARLDQWLLMDPQEFGAIATHFRSALKDVYVAPAPALGKPIVPSYFKDSVPSDADFRGAYDLMLAYLELSTGSGLRRPVPPPGSPQEFFEELGKSLSNTATSVGESLGGSNAEWWEILLAPLLAVLYGAVLVFKILTLPVAALTRLATLHPRWLAYLLQNALHNAASELRWSLALSGLAKPARDDERGREV